MFHKKAFLGSDWKHVNCPECERTDRQSEIKLYWAWTHGKWKVFWGFHFLTVKYGEWTVDGWGFDLYDSRVYQYLVTPQYGYSLDEWKINWRKAKHH